MARQAAIRALSAATQRALSMPARQLAYGALRATVGSQFVPQEGCASRWGLTRGFSASALRSSDATEKALGDMIAEELKTEKSSYENPEELKEGPPKPFQLKESDGSSEVVLTQSYGKETISVSFVVDEEADPEDVDSFEDEEDQEEEGTPSIYFMVDIEKPGAETLTFECTTNGTNISVNSVHLEAPEKDDAAYKGPPDYAVLDDALHDCFDKYLEARGINEDLAQYIVDFADDKEQREYMKWLERMEKFLKA